MVAQASACAAHLTPAADTAIMRRFSARFHSRMRHRIDTSAIEPVLEHGHDSSRPAVGGHSEVSSIADTATIRQRFASR